MMMEYIVFTMLSSAIPSSVNTLPFSAAHDVVLLVANHIGDPSHASNKDKTYNRYFILVIITIVSLASMSIQL